MSIVSSLLPNVCLDLVGLVVLADLPAVSEGTTLAGNAFWTDILILCPGIHRQQLAAELNKGEYPATAALTTGYVLRVENQATVYFLQKVSKTGHLTTVSVKKATHAHSPSKLPGPYGAAALLTMCSLVALFLIDWWAMTLVGVLMTARLLNMLVIRSRTSNPGWKGIREPGIHGDLLILLSQDRWVRMQGLVDDLKAVTSGQWLRDATFTENMTISAATLLVYLAAALAINANKVGQTILLLLFVVSFGFLALSNFSVESLQMHGCVVRCQGRPKAYRRRLDLAKELIEESGRSDWAIRLGMIVSDRKASSEDEQAAWHEEVTM